MRCSRRASARTRSRLRECRQRLRLIAFWWLSLGLVGDRYKFSHITRAMRALQGSLKTSLRINDEGLLSLQFMMPAPRRPSVQRSEAFVEFWVSLYQDCVEH